MSSVPEYFAIEEAVKAFRENGATRREASHFVCKKLLYDLGETPTVRIVREITHWGSYSDVNQDVKSFMRSTDFQPHPHPETKLPFRAQAYFRDGLLELYAHAHAEASRQFEEARQNFMDERKRSADREKWLRDQLTALQQRNVLLTSEIERLQAETAEKK